MAVHQALFEQFVKAHATPPRRLVLDVDATDTPLHGEQEDWFFHGLYYDTYCYLPLYVFCGRHLLVNYLRPSGVDPARHAWAILSLLVKALRAHWPRVEIVVRGDSGFCRRAVDVAVVRSAWSALYRGDREERPSASESGSIARTCGAGLPSHGREKNRSLSDLPCMACSSQFQSIGYRSVQSPCLSDGIRHLHEVHCLSSLHLIHGKSDTLQNPTEARLEEAWEQEHPDSVAR